MKRQVRKIVSGGQTGVDRAALDVALVFDIPHGGWCPKGRRAEDGRISREYDLSETPASAYAVRTRWNVRDSDGTLILLRGTAEGGTKLTLTCARHLAKPVFLMDVAGDPLKTGVCDWLKLNRIGILNVAGPRESEAPGIYREARRLLEQLLRGQGGLAV